MRDSNRWLVAGAALLVLLVAAPRHARADDVVEGAVLSVPVRLESSKVQDRSDCGGKAGAPTKPARRVGRLLAPRDAVGQKA
jgi:hypothetical protein